MITSSAQERDVFCWGMSDFLRAGQDDTINPKDHFLGQCQSQMNLTNCRNRHATMHVAALAHFAVQADAGHSWHTCIKVESVATCNCKWAAELRNLVCFRCLEDWSAVFSLQIQTTNYPLDFSGGGRGGCHQDPGIAALAAS